MISKLWGKVEDINLSDYILNVGGVGYKINSTLSDVGKVKTGKDLAVNTFLDVKEKSLELYGFLESEDKKFFELLLGVNGIGPKTAMQILNRTTKETLIEGISSGDGAHLSQISGLGKKQAEKIVLALKDKIDSVSVKGGIKGGTSDTIDALLSLGYSAREAREAISGLDKGMRPEAMIKEALKNLNQ
jgi:holliday junction DNA helicase RuvA